MKQQPQISQLLRGGSIIVRDLSFVATFQKLKLCWPVYTKKVKQKVLLGIFLMTAVVVSALIFSAYSSHNLINSSEVSTRPNLTYTGRPEGERQISQAEKDISLQILDGYSVAIKFFAPVFDSFIGETPDVTGKVYNSGNGFEYHPFGTGSLTFSSGDKLITVGFNAFEISNIFLGIVTVILTLLISIRTLNIITDEDSDAAKLKPFIQRIVSTVILILLTPHILGLSIFITNVFVRSFTNNSSLTTFMGEYLQELRNGVEDAPTESKWFNFGGAANPNNLLEGVISSLPLNLSLLLILILFLFISFQFVIRFINLFFLYAIHPLVIVFYAHEKTAYIPTNFWKIWISFLIHQPAFIIGFYIVQQILNDVLIQSGPEPQLLILFLGLLLFLASINIIAGRIFSEGFSAISTNIQSGIASRFAIGAGRQILRQPGNIVSGLSKFNSANKFSQNGVQLGKSLRDKNSQNGSLGSKSNLKVKHKKLYNPEKSTIGNEYTRKGFSVKPSSGQDGVLDVSGTFYSSKDQTSDSKVYYTSREDALSDKAKEADIVEEKSNIKILDPSNRDARQQYNIETQKQAQKAGISQSKARITQSPSEDQLKRNMDIMKDQNMKKGIQGIATTRYPKGTKPEDGAKQIHKIIKY